MPADLSGRHEEARRACARAGARSRVLLVDEPSAGLDPITAEEIDDLLVGTERGTEAPRWSWSPTTSRARVTSATNSSCFTRAGSSRRGTPAELERSDNELVQAFMTSKNAG